MNAGSRLDYLSALKPKTKTSISYMTVEYRCTSCMRKTEPPAPYKMYVLCDCGHMSAATAAAVKLSERDVLDFPLSIANPHAVAFIRKIELERIKTQADLLVMLNGQAKWADKEPLDCMTPLFDQAYVSILEAEIERLNNRVRMLEACYNKKECDG